jgi:2-oxoglutarate dehydrogenase E1 component
MNGWSDISALNTGPVMALYERYRRDPASVDAATREFFHHWTPPENGATAVVEGAATAADVAAVVGAVNLAHAIRAHGHLAARLDPLGRPRPGDPSLDPAAHGVTDDALRRLPARIVGGPLSRTAPHALAAMEALRRVYTSTTGYDYDHIRAPAERTWLRDAAESGRFRPPGDPLDARGLLERLTQVETFERFLHRVFPGRTRFSIEGLDMLVPMLDEAIGRAAREGAHTILVGMAHRGRLNVLAHILGKPYAAILAEFKDPVRGRQFRDDLGWTGDVTYHKGARREVPGGASGTLAVTLVPNPSHVEASDPIVIGMARAAGTRADRRGAPQLEPTGVLAVLIHGDAAFPAEGVVAETLNLSRLRGYAVGGTVHLIADNQIGYTTVPADGYSTSYASDLAKGFEIPVVHVNADDPEACIEAVRLAVAYRAAFNKDFVIDLVGYRRHGHNEGDEPAFTQPVMYRRIAEHPTVRAIWADTLVARGVVDGAWPAERVRRDMAVLEEALRSLRPEEAVVEPRPSPPPAGAARAAHTAVPAERLRALHRDLLRIHEGFSIHPKLARAIERRRAALDSPDEPTIDWATAEQLALASVLADGIPVRLTGQDTERGTFSQRHAVFHDTRTGARYAPLQALAEARAACEIYNSPLTENAALGFEYGYSIQAPDRLVIWEAQYGDFVNNAQVIVDEFIAPARAKWGHTPSLVLLLPHGAEGQGPDHSSGRLERFLQLAAETNMRIANCTRAAQYFHLLRRQALLLRTDPLPLIVMTPKSLLRHPAVGSSLRDLTEGGWQPVLDDPRAGERRASTTRLLLCTGKIAMDLLDSELRDRRPGVAVVRLEQLYPLPVDDLRRVVEAYRGLREVVWVQEEPQNMGAWTYMQPQLSHATEGRYPLEYVGRPPNASPAEGSHARHVLTQAALLRRAYGVEGDPCR